MAPDLISLFKKLHWQPGHAECKPDPGKGEDRRKGYKEKKNGFDIQAGGLRGGNKFTALSENMAACCVMDHGALGLPSRGGTRGGTHGNPVSQEERSHPDVFLNK